MESKEYPSLPSNQWLLTDSLVYMAAVTHIDINIWSNGHNEIPDEHGLPLINRRNNNQNIPTDGEWVQLMEIIRNGRSITAMDIEVEEFEGSILSGFHVVQTSNHFYVAKITPDMVKNCLENALGQSTPGPHSLMNDDDEWESLPDSCGILSKYNDSYGIEYPGYVNWREHSEHPLVEDFRRDRMMGWDKVTVLQSTIAGSGWGLFATKDLEKGDVISKLRIRVYLWKITS
jgi:hypothetical protein